MHPLKVTIVSPSISRSGGGVSEVVRSTAIALHTIPSLDVTIETLQDEFFEADVDLCGNVPVRAHKVFGPPSFGFSPGLAWALLRARCDLVHVHGLWMFHCAAVVVWSLVKKGKYIVTPHGMLEQWILRRSAAAKKLVSLTYHDLFLHRASCFQALTEKEVEDIKNAVGNCAICMIPNYVEINKKSVSAAPPWWRNEFVGRDVYLFFARIHEKKGCLELCEAWKRACARDASFRDRSILVFCGWIDQLPQFEAQVEALNEQFHNVYFAGPQYGDAKRLTFAAASVLVLPSKSEGLPLTILEGWAQAVAVMMTQHCNLSTAFSKGAAIEIGEDAQSIAESLLSFSRMNQQERRNIGLSGQLFLAANFSKDVVVTQLKRLYQRVVFRSDEVQQ